MSFALLFSVFVIATCGLVYELIAGALASYLLGDSVTQFSTIIGVYLFSMGIGSYLSKYINRRLIETFVRVEIIVGLVGGFSAAILFLIFEHVGSFRIVLYSLVTITGALVGLEIPLLMRILKDRLEFKDLVSKVFTVDYVGALIASLLFPLVLVPQLGLIRSAFMFGIFNVVVAIWSLRIFRENIGSMRSMQVFAGASLLALVIGFVSADRIMDMAESSAYSGTVVYSKSSPYQRIVLTKEQDDLRLFLNGNLQFSSRDEYRYHEALVHVGLAALNEPKRVLVLGGGDGLAVREVLKYKSVEHVTLVDLDPSMTTFFSVHEGLAKLNENSLTNPKVRVINDDAFLWLKREVESKGFQPYDFIVVDFPDPSNFSIGKLYSNSFFRVLNHAISEMGSVAVQSTSPIFARKSFWCVNATMGSVGFRTVPYHAYVPSFGEWGFVLGTKGHFQVAEKYPEGLKFITPEVIPHLLTFPPDMAFIETDVNKLNNQVLVRYFEDEWAKYVH